MGPTSQRTWKERSTFLCPCGKCSQKTVVSFHHKFQSFKQWEESFTNVTGKTKDQTFIAALQRAIASRAKCLLLFGGGSYELLAFRDYLRNNPDRSKQCWRCIDVRTNFKQSFLQQFQGMGHLNISSTSDLYKGTLTRYCELEYILHSHSLL